MWNDISILVTMADYGALHSLSTKRSSKGRQTCRNDEVHPECGGCVRNGLLCQWPVDTSRRRRRHQNARLWPSGIDIPQGLDAMVVVFAVPSRLLPHLNAAAVLLFYCNGYISFREIPKCERFS